MSRIHLYAHNKVARMVVLVTAVAMTIAFLFSGSMKIVLAEDNKPPPHLNYIPVAAQPDLPVIKNTNALALVNQLRAEVGVPPVSDSGALNNNCFEHARYMAENNVLVHDQDPNLPFASTSGQNCAQNANAWLGSNKAKSDWSPNDSVQVWMGSVGHRLWVLYPTTKTVGYGFFSTPEENRAAAALDILSSAKFDADETYSGWPVKYPTGGVPVPATRYPITLNWRYFGGNPQLGQTQLRTAAGQNLAHDATTTLPVGHKGIQIIPKHDLPPYSNIIVTVSGTYEGQPFSYTWDFHTGE